MQDTNPQELMRAMEIFKEREGIKTPLDMFKLDKIIEELRAKNKENK